ncbi:Ribonuclease H-like domain containing protein [Parasponia andersonii]|uniref:Ribonuclease H-like domain containing protein n=1 Tax=Parasponia andersonii TaxID=3476 RepID=A0A2P5BD36_PARAD|nr:Ribonuclease H-like domain containing protein [Parasponia andersonii]
MGSDNRVGLGAVVRNGKGEIMLVAAIGCHGLKDVVLAEDLAIRNGLQLSIEAGVWAVLETDSIAVVNMLKEKE